MNDAVYLPILSVGTPLQLSVLTISSSKLRAYLTRISTHSPTPLLVDCLCFLKQEWNIIYLCIHFLASDLIVVIFQEAERKREDELANYEQEKEAIQTKLDHSVADRESLLEELSQLQELNEKKNNNSSKTGEYS